MKGFKIEQYIYDPDGEEISEETMEEFMDKFLDLVDLYGLHTGGTYGEDLDE